MNLPSQADPKPLPPVRCLVIQLARLGDTIQSLMALRAAKQLYPSLEIHFLARERFAVAAKRVPWIQKVISFPADQILGPILLGDKNAPESLGDLARWIAPLVKDPWDVVVNWTFSEASSYLTALIPSRVKLGYTRRRDSSFSGADGWSHFIQAIVQGKVNQNIHLTDILTTQLLTALQIHFGEPTGDGNSTVTSKTFFSLALNESELETVIQGESKSWISIQLGAGQATKAWDAENWAKLIQHILKRNPEHSIYLLGGKEDEEKANLILREVDGDANVVSLVGKTGYDLWTSVVARSQWLFAADTAAIHLASVLGVRVFNISVGPVRYFETGPYGNGHYVIAPAHICEACNRESLHLNEHTCRTDISAEAAYATWAYAAKEWAHRRMVSLETHFSELGWSDKLNSIRIFRSRIRNSSDGGGVQYEPQLKKPLSMEEWTGMVMGHMARAWYCGWLPPIGKEITREAISPQLIQKLREISESTQVLSKICLQASQTAKALNQRGSALKSEKVMGLRDRTEIQELGKTLTELEGLMERVTNTHPPLKGFSQMSKVLMHHLQGTQLSDLGKETAESYKQLNEGIQLFKQWIQSTLDIAKPVAVKSATISTFEKEIST